MLVRSYASTFADFFLNGCWTAEYRQWSFFHYALQTIRKMYCTSLWCVVLGVRLLGACWRHDFDYPEQNMVASFSRFNFLICSPSSSSLSRSEKHSFLFTFFCFDLKVLDKTGRRKLQLELEHLKRQTLVTSKMIFFMELG